MTLVSVGIPTFNRAARLRRAAESVLSQTHDELELVISDNASSDETAAVCAELCARDARVRYLRSETNRGPTANFNVLYEAVSGEYAMVLSDDDWLDADYLQRCLEELLADPRRALVCGRARYLDGERVVRLGVPFVLEDPDPRRRVLAYLDGVDENGLFYGLARREALRSVAPLRNVLANDWLIVAGLLMAGTAATLETTAISREVGGTSADFQRLTATLGLPRAQARLPHVVMAWQVLAEILWRGRAFRGLGARARAGLAVAAAARVLDWRSDAWFLTAPTAAALGRRRGGAVVWRAYLALTRRLGATHERLPE
jgi:hypothetical protein